MNHNYLPFWYLAGIISYEEFEDLTKKNKEKESRAYLEKIHEANSNKRTRDSSTTFLDPYEHLDFKPFFESLRDRYEIPICCELYTFSHQDVKAPTTHPKALFDKLCKRKSSRNRKEIFYLVYLTLIFFNIPSTDAKVNPNFCAP